MANKYEEMIAEGRKNILAQGRNCSTIRGKKLSLHIDGFCQTMRIHFDGHVLSIPLEIAAWLSPNIDMLYGLALEHKVFEEWWLDVEPDEE